MKKSSWEIGELYVADVGNTIGSLNLMSISDSTTNLNSVASTAIPRFFQHIKTGEIIVPIGSIWSAYVGSTYVKVITSRGVGYMAEWIFKRNVKSILTHRKITLKTDPTD